MLYFYIPPVIQSPIRMYDTWRLQLLTVKIKRLKIGIFFNKKTKLQILYRTATLQLTTPPSPPPPADTVTRSRYRCSVLVTGSS
jgi:hypothetical protein